jgi:hypothetical protein
MTLEVVLGTQAALALVDDTGALSHEPHFRVIRLSVRAHPFFPSSALSARLGDSAPLDLPFDSCRLLRFSRFRFSPLLLSRLRFLLLRVSDLYFSRCHCL